MSDAGLGVCVARLLKGDIRADDLSQLFLHVRERCDGRESVQEIGDFVAHRNDQTKALVTRTAKDWSIVVHFMMPRFGAGQEGQKLNPSRLPPNTPNFLGACLRRLDNAMVKQHTGMNKAEALRLLPRIVERVLVRNPDGTYQISTSVQAKEFALIRCLCTYIVVETAFSPDRLFSDFRDTLRSNGLLAKADFPAFAALEEVVALYAVSVMHNCTLVLDDGSRYELFARANETGTSIEVMSEVPVAVDAGPQRMMVAAPIFSVSGPTEHLCQPALRELPSWKGVTLGLTADRQLGLL